jgi:transcriptional regulator
MGIEQFIKLSNIGESTRIEYKMCTEKITESLYETVCSFLNHSGGYILVGVKNNGKIVGVNPDKADALKANIITSIKNQELFLPCPYFTPQILEVDGKIVLLLDIPCGQYVYRYNGRYWDRNEDMSPETGGNVTRKQEMSQENKDEQGKMSLEHPLELEDDELKISLGDTSNKKSIVKKRKRQQGIIGLIKENSNITIEAMAEKLDVTERTIKRDVEELKNVIEHVGPTKGGHWVVKVNA